MSGEEGSVIDDADALEFMLLGYALGLYAWVMRFWGVLLRWVLCSLCHSSTQGLRECCRPILPCRLASSTLLAGILVCRNRAIRRDRRAEKTLRQKLGAVLGNLCEISMGLVLRKGCEGGERGAGCAGGERGAACGGCVRGVRAGVRGCEFCHTALCEFGNATQRRFWDYSSTKKNICKKIFVECSCVCFSVLAEVGRSLMALGVLLLVSAREGLVVAVS